MAKAEYKSAIRSRRMIQRALVELLQEKELDKITVTDIVCLLYTSPLMPLGVKYLKGFSL